MKQFIRSSHSPANGLFRLFTTVVILQLLLIIAALALRLNPPDSFSPPPRPSSPFAHADELFGSGHYVAAWQEYQQLAEQEPKAEWLLRMGMILTVRGEYGEAARKLHAALGSGLLDEPANLALLYLSRCLWAQGLREEAEQAWARIHRPSSLEGPGLVLKAEWALQQGYTNVASTTYATALQSTLPADWIPTVVHRIALLQAARDPDTARTSLQQLVDLQQTGEANQICLPPHISVAPPNPLIRPLIPDTRKESAQFLALLSIPPPESHQLLGQYVLERGWNTLALEQFQQIDEQSPDDIRLLAMAYAGYTRWRLGETTVGIQAVQALANAFPENPQFRTLLVLMLLESDKPDASMLAQIELDALLKEHPMWPGSYLADSRRAMQQHDYAAAMRALHQALALVVDPPERRGRYALLVAQFHLTTTYGLCEYGLPAAEQATQLLRNHAQAWTTLAAIRYHCRSFVEAVVAARIAQAWGGGAAASYYLGAALLELAQWDDARAMLIQAADMAPASVWRERAEQRLAWLMHLQQ